MKTKNELMNNTLIGLMTNKGKLDGFLNTEETWVKIKKYINELEIGDLLTEENLKEVSGMSLIIKRGLSQSSVKQELIIDVYRYHLVKSGILKFITHNTYRKVTHIPARIEIIDLKRIVLDIQRNPWMEWFVPLHKRFGVTEEELYGE